MKVKSPFENRCYIPLELVLPASNSFEFDVGVGGDKFIALDVIAANTTCVANIHDEIKIRIKYKRTKHKFNDGRKYAYCILSY